MDLLRIGIIGIGNMGMHHARNIFQQKINNCQLTAVCDKDLHQLENAQQDFPGISCFENHETLINSGIVNAVVIATPHYSHCPIAIDSFNAGLHVLCEKPSGSYTKQVLDMNKAAIGAGTTFAVMLNQRTEPIYQKIRDTIKCGELGQIQRFNWNVTNWYREQSYYDSAIWRGTWDGEGGGVLINQAVHNLDIWQWTIGLPDKLTAFCGFGKHHKIEVEDEAILIGEYDNGCTVQFITSTGEPFGFNRLEIIGKSGRLTAENGKLLLCKQPDGKPEDITPDYSGSGHNGILQNFTNAILYGESLIAPGQDGINSLELVNAALFSAWENKTVMLPVDPDIYYKMLNEKAAKSLGKSAPDAIFAQQPKADVSGRWQVRW